MLLRALAFVLALCGLLHLSGASVLVWAHPAVWLAMAVALAGIFQAGSGIFQAGSGIFQAGSGRRRAAREWVAWPLLVVAYESLRELADRLTPWVRDHYLVAADNELLPGLDALLAPLRGSTLSPTWALLVALVPALPAVLALRLGNRARRRLLVATSFCLALAAAATVLMPSVGPGEYLAHEHTTNVDGQTLSPLEHEDAVRAVKRSRIMGAWPMDAGHRQSPLSLPIMLLIAGVLAARASRWDALVYGSVLAAAGVGTLVLRQTWLSTLIPAAAAGALCWLGTRNLRLQVRSVTPARATESASPGLGFVFGLSGAAALIYQLVAARSLTSVFGGMADAIATVLATYMAGLSIGAWIGGRIADRVKHPVRLYAIAEVIIAATVLLLPLGRDMALDFYVSAVKGGAGPVLATTLRVVLSAIVLLPPTLAMGATLPLLVADWMRRDPEATRAIPRLYAANTLGAAVGILAGTYLILPYLGIFRTLVLVAALDLIAAAGAIWVTRRIRKTGTHSQPREPREPTDDVIRPRALIAAVFTGSVVLFGLEVQWTHTLAVVVGNSAYAFGIMLFCVLAGLAIGGRSAERVPPALRPDALSRDAVLFAAVVGASLLLWDRVPMLFHVMGYSAHSFSARESIRFLVCLAFLFPPCFLSGRIYALAMALYASAGAGVGKRVGGLSAASTVGAVIGSLSGSFLILPLLGSDLGMRVAAAGLLGTAALYALAMRTSANGQRVAVLAGVATIALLAFIPRWNVNRLTDGANVYFQAQWPGETVFVHEDKFGGLTTVREHTDGTYTLLTNGKFQGSNSNEVEAQRSFALFPILHQQQFGKALVVGLGTGMTAATVARFPFEEVVVAEISPGIIEAARRYFGDINDGVVDRLGSSLKREDGRHQLLITNDHYDLISMEITSIWFAGAAALYNREFYDMVRGRLTQTGIFQQWIQLHHIYPKDLASVLASLRAVFPHVELFVGGGQGVLVAAVNPLHADPVKLRGWCQQARFTDACRLAGGRLDAVPLDDARLLDGAGIDRFLSQVASELGVDVASLISTDDSLSLEYATPRGNVLPEDSGMRMRRYLAGFQEN